MVNETWLVVSVAIVLVVPRLLRWQRLMLRYMVVPVLCIVCAVRVTGAQSNIPTSVALQGKDGQEHDEVRMDPI